MRCTVTAANVGQRLDQLLAKKCQISRSHLVKLLEATPATVNGSPQKPSYLLRLGDKIDFAYQPPQQQTTPKIDLPILYEDADCLVINKPIGLLSHSKGAFNPEATVATFIEPKLSGFSDSDRAGIVHRLDRATSGVMICAKTPAALSWLQKQFSQRKVKKTYYAVIAGSLEPTEAIIDMAIERNPKAPKTFQASHTGRPATTKYKVVRQSVQFSLVELKPQTGRTHQLRVHLKQVGHPIVGDQMYGGLPAERLMLHAESLEITLPNHSRQVFTAPLPKGFTEL